ncbi:MAG: CBS domain-containing protein, partial [Pseudomonadota bacterium]
ERRGVHLAAGPQAYLPATIDVGAIMRMRGGDQSASDTMCQELMEQGVQLSRSDTLETALPMFERSGAAFLPVVEDGDLLGAVFHLDALKALNRALIATAHEEHS